MAQTLFTARAGGHSQGAYSSLNLADHVGDEPETVAANRKILGELVSQNALAFMEQVHGDTVVKVGAKTIFPVVSDALITNEPGFGLVVMAADCLPILISGENMVGAIHAGRKGVLNGIIAKTVNAMKSEGAGDLTATIGPAICRDCYEVSQEMYLEAISIIPELATSAVTHKLDLLSAAKAQLQKLGVQVLTTNICTAENVNYFSYRRDGQTGRNAGVIVL